MRNLFITFIALAIASAAAAASLEIVDVKRNIPLAETDPVYKDFYIKVSGKGDLKKNQVVKATRKITVKDTSLKAVGDFTTVIGFLKIVQVSDTIAVGREFKLIPRSDEAMIEQIGFMVGDEIDTSESFTDISKPGEKSRAPSATDVVPNAANVVPTGDVTAPPAPKDI